jgi:hypothetical protein
VVFPVPGRPTVKNSRRFIGPPVHVAVPIMVVGVRYAYALI